ncbi:hypothetical protein ELB75_06300 [Eikenella corrodens]|uniref:Uncharacterized protein n=1 Tax=Eikenella corrodens TaxID=539 RepID=A0A3S9SJE7_EIKCO|nr:hypothetical protein ELB75_06300 [Eikenella corrodens]
MRDGWVIAGVAPANCGHGRCRRQFVPAECRLGRYSGLNLNQYGVGSPCRNVCTVCGSPPCPDFC